MNSSSVVKVVAAFVTGILVALVGALAYVRISDRSVPEPKPEPATKSSPAPERVAAAKTSSEMSGQQTLVDEDRRVKPTRRGALSPVGHKFTRQSKQGGAGEPVARLTPPHLPSSGEPESNDLPASPYPKNETNPIDNATQSSGLPAGPVQQPAAAPEPQAPVREPQSVTLERGTSVVIRLGESLSTEHNYTGDTFRGTLDVPVIMNGFVIADKGSKVLGRIVNAEKAGRVRGVADLALALTEINTTDGQRVAVETGSFDKKGSNNTGRDAAKVAGGAALGAIIGAIAGGGKGAGIGAGVGGAAGAGDVLLTHGQPAVVPNETVLTFRLSAPVAITERLN